MITGWEVYLWTRLDLFNVSNLPLFFLLASVGVCLCGLIMTMAGWEFEDLFKKLSPHLKPLLYVFAFYLFLCLLIPSKKDAAMIWVLPQIATTENADLLKGEAAEIYTLAKEALKESIGVPEKE